MKAKLAFIAGIGIGYVVGTRVGRRGYEALKSNARAVWQQDSVQETVSTLENTLKEEAKGLGTRLINKVTKDHAVESGGAKKGAVPESTNATSTESEPNDLEVLADVDSDPALNDELGQDWADEGGALPSGPRSARRQH